MYIATVFNGARLHRFVLLPGAVSFPGITGGRRLDVSDQPGIGKKVLRGFFIVCAILFLIDFLVHRHGHFSMEELPGFFALYGLVSCVFLVIISKFFNITIIF